jgi:predicted Zn-dependent protease
MNMTEGHSGVPTFLSTHPDPGDRYNSVNLAAKAWQDSLKLSSWKVNSDNYLKMIDGMIYGDDPKQGYVEGNVFYHPDLKFRFSFPSGWKLENTPAQVNMAPQDGKSLVVFTLASGKSLDEAATGTIQQLGLTVENSGPATINKLPARVIESRQILEDQSTGQKQTNKILSYIIQCDSLFYVFHGVAGETDYGAASNSFKSTMESFSRLTDASKINIRPKRILIKKVQRTGTLADAFAYYGVKQDKRAELALLNNLELADKVQAGKLIKIIGE